MIIASVIRRCFSHDDTREMTEKTLRQIVEREGMGVDFGGIEALLRHECLGAMGRAFALARMP
jgi:hypothetical protein